MEQIALKGFKNSHRRYSRLDKENCINVANMTEVLDEKPKVPPLPSRVNQIRVNHLGNVLMQRKNTYNFADKQHLNMTLQNRQLTQQLNIKPTSLPRKQQSRSSIYPSQIFKQANLLDTFQITDKIGRGSYATVSLAIEKNSNDVYAVKIYQKLALREPHRLENIKREVKNLKHLCHKNIVNLIQASHDKRRIYLLLEYGGKNSMYSILKKREKRRFTEQEAKKYFKQLLEALNYCHKRKITHRDIKLENILINDHNELKLIDFGFSVYSKDKLSSFCGTPSYMAPEIVSKTNYEGQFVDIWACGVLLYVMLCGCYPFKASEQNQLYKKIKSGRYQFKQDIQLSSEAKNLIGRMLKAAPCSRGTAEELLSDAWFKF